MIAIGLSPAVALWRWHPRYLFANGEKGAVYDPSDLSTLWQDSARTTPVADYGDPVGAMDDKSGNDNHATQATAAARPIYGRVPATGRRNFGFYTEAFEDAYWDEKVDVTVTDGYATSSRGSATRVVTSASTARVTRSSFPHPANTDLKISYVVKRLSGTGLIGIQLRAHVDYFDLSDGSLVSGGTGAAITALGDDEYLIESRVLNRGEDSNRCGILFNGDSGDDFLISGFMAETGSTVTAYQKVTSQYDVSESGVRDLYYLFDDGVDDVLNVTLPDLGTDATVAYASDQGVTTQTGQTIGAGAFDVLRDDMLFGMVVIDRALSTAETARLTAWLNHKAGDYA